MAVSLSTNTIKLYDPETGSFKGDLLGHTCTISGLNFPDPSSPQLLFSSSADSTIRTWDVRVGKQVGVQFLWSDVPALHASQFITALTQNLGLE